MLFSRYRNWINLVSWTMCFFFFRFLLLSLFRVGRWSIDRATMFLFMYVLTSSCHIVRYCVSVGDLCMSSAGEHLGPGVDGVDNVVVTWWICLNWSESMEPTDLFLKISALAKFHRLKEKCEKYSFYIDTLCRLLEKCDGRKNNCENLWHPPEAPIFFTK